MEEAMPSLSISHKGGQREPSACYCSTGMKPPVKVSEREENTPNENNENKNRGHNTETLIPFRKRRKQAQPGLCVWIKPSMLM